MCGICRIDLHGGSKQSPDKMEVSGEHRGREGDTGGELLSVFMAYVIEGEGPEGTNPATKPESCHCYQPAPCVWNLPITTCLPFCVTPGRGGGDKHSHTGRLPDTT